MPSEVPSTNGEVGAAAARRKYGLEDLPGTTGFADAKYRSNGRRVSIKRALYQRASGDPGVFRVWREHLDQLKNRGGSVVLVVENPSNPHRQVLKVTKRSPAELLETSEFRPTGQADMKGMHEARIPWREVVSL